MSLKAVYERFLADPNSAVLSPDVSLNYVTTTTAIQRADVVISHLSSQKRIVKRKSDKILNSIEGQGSLCLDVETTLEFVSGGGAYLPSLDETFLIDRLVTFPMIHIVRFDSQKRIQQIRLYWDQGSLLKLVDVIGSRGRNWPIRDAQDQTRLITTAVSSLPQDIVPPPPAQVRSQLPPGSRNVKDPRAPLSLFSSDGPGEEPAVFARASAKRPPRDYNELFIGDADLDTSPTTLRKDPMAPKVGAGKNFQPVRLFDDDEALAAEEKIYPKAGSSKNFQPSRVFLDEETAAKEQADQKESHYKLDSSKYNHFELGGDNTELEIKSTPSRPKAQHTSQWNFDDFSTIEKPRGKIRGQDVRHFGWSDDEGDLKETPPARPRVFQPRRDAEQHFQFEEDGSSARDNPHMRLVGSAHNKGLGLYDSLYDEQGNPNPNESGSKAPLSILPNGAHRKKDFDHHWSISNTSPPDDKPKGENKPIATDRMMAVKMMDASWDSYSESPEQSKMALPPGQAKRMNRNANQRSWGFGDDSF
jgi:hypothetical protein